MLARLELLWAEVRDSLWFLPGLITLFSALLAFVTIAIDSTAPPGFQIVPFWTANGVAEGARGVLAAIATSIITVTGVVFSVTVVALQLASSQYSPRVLRIFMHDRESQIVLGVLMGTFVYALLVLRTVRSASQDTVEFVPSLSVTVAIILTIAAVGFLIFFIDHMARSLETSAMMDRATKPVLRNVDNIFPETIGEAVEPARFEAPVPKTVPGTISSADTGYLLKIDENALVDAAKRSRLTVRMDVAIGEFILPGTTIASVWPQELLDTSISDAVRRAYILGKRRNPEQDLEYSVVELADIGVKALSPGINDPTAAKICIDRLSEILVVLGNREMPDILRTDPRGRLLFVARRTSYERVVCLAFHDIRHFGVPIPSVAAHLLRSLGRIVAQVRADRRAPLRSQARLALASAHRDISNQDDLAEVEQAAKWLDVQEGPSTSEER